MGMSLGGSLGSGFGGNFGLLNSKMRNDPMYRLFSSGYDKETQQTMSISDLWKKKQAIELEQENKKKQAEKEKADWQAKLRTGMGDLFGGGLLTKYKQIYDYNKLGFGGDSKLGA